MKVTFVIGMAGSGKTTLVATYAQHCKAYIVNLDPAVQSLPYEPNVDIRDSINYMELQEKNHLGPNGAIMTALALYSSKVPHLVRVCSEGASKLGCDEIILDAPGYIEVFAWSAAGELLVDHFSRAFPTAVLYLADAKRAALPNAFVSGMLYFLSVKQRLQLSGKILACYNKADLLVQKEAYRLNYFTYSSLELLDAFEDPELLDQGDYALAFLEYVVTQLDEFWLGEQFHVVSALTGEGIDSMRYKLGHIADYSFQEYYYATDDAGKERLQEMDNALERLEVSLEPQVEHDADNLDGVE